MRSVALFFELFSDIPSAIRANKDLATSTIVLMKVLVMTTMAETIAS